MEAGPRTETIEAAGAQVARARGLEVGAKPTARGASAGSRRFRRAAPRSTRARAQIALIDSQLADTVAIARRSTAWCW